MEGKRESRAGVQCLNTERPRFLERLAQSTSRAPTHGINNSSFPVGRDGNQVGVGVFHCFEPVFLYWRDLTLSWGCLIGAFLC